MVVGHWICLALLSAAAGAASAATTMGTVVGVSDGDTITVLDSDKRQHKVRLAGIDAPEKRQPFGQRAKEGLSGLVFGKEVEVQWRRRDRYHRIIGKVMVADGGCQAAVCPKTIDSGLRQVQGGLAWWYRQYAREQSAADATAYEAAELAARAGRIGLWSDAAPIPPWEWRRTHR